ncbi:MAG: CvpA family protein, partial [Clostridiales bacterium]|nr:CvpA family protein [Clostridiales bacterium]
MNIVDIIIIALLALSIFNGFRRGVVNSFVTLVGTILAFVVAFYLKTPVSIFMYEHLPFFSIG